MGRTSPPRADPPLVRPARPCDREGGPLCCTEGGGNDDTPLALGVDASDASLTAVD